MDTIYLVYENSDKTEGRGSMEIVKNSGFFETEEEAWKFADTCYGVMGRKPHSGSWKNESYPDVKVIKIFRHNSKYWKESRELEKQINELNKKLDILKKTKADYERYN